MASYNLGYGTLSYAIVSFNRWSLAAGCPVLVAACCPPVARWLPESCLHLLGRFLGRCCLPWFFSIGGIFLVGGGFTLLTLVVFFIFLPMCLLLLEHQAHLVASCLGLVQVFRLNTPNFLETFLVKVFLCIGGQRKNPITDRGKSWRRVRACCQTLLSAVVLGCRRRCNIHKLF